jgi:DNA-binding transcriptional LysR family regulator
VSLVSTTWLPGRLVHWGDIEGPGDRAVGALSRRALLSARVSTFLDFLKEAFPTGSPDELAAFID